MVDFLIIYELVQREMENVALLSAELENRGYTVELVKFPFKNISKLRKKYLNNVKVVLTQSMYSEAVLHNLVYHIAGKVQKIVNLQWEQIGTVSDEENNCSARMPKGSAKNVPHICWGGRPQEMLIKAGMDENRAVITGPIQMDFLREEFDAYYKGREELYKEFEIPCDKKTALFISSLSYTSLDENEIHRLEKALGEEFVTVFRDVSIKTQKAVLEWIGKALSEDEELIFIYRPHPAEAGSKLLKEAQKKYSRFFVINKYSVKQWIKRCDIIYNWFSTSAAEVYYAGKNAFVLRPVELPGKYEVALLKDCSFITSYEEFRDSLCKKEGITVSEEIIKRYYDVSEVPSYVRLTDFLEKVINTNEFDYKWSKETQKFCKAHYKKREWHIFLVNMKVAGLYVINSIKKLLGTSFDEHYTSFYKNRKRVVREIKAEEQRIRETMRTIVKKLAERGNL